MKLSSHPSKINFFSITSFQCDYENVATTVFTPLEYGTCGLSEEDAISRYGEDNITTYHSNFTPLEATVAHRLDNGCYAKLICNKTDNVCFVLIGPTPCLDIS